MGLSILIDDSLWNFVIIGLNISAFKGYVNDTPDKSSALMRGLQLALFCGFHWQSQIKRRQALIAKDTFLGSLFSLLCQYRSLNFAVLFYV